MIKQIYIIVTIFIVSTTFYSCDEFGVEPSEGNLTYKLIGNTPASNEEGLYIARLDDYYVLGGLTDITSTTDYTLTKVDKYGNAPFNFYAGLPLKDDGLKQVIVTDEANNELFALLNQESKQTFKVTPSLVKVTYETPDSNTKLGDSIFIERDNFPNENDILREVAVEGIYLENTNQFLILSNITEKDNQKIRITLLDEFGGNAVWSRVYAFDNGAFTSPSLEGVGVSVKGSGNFTIMGNLTTEDANTRDRTVRVFAIEIDDLGNEVNVKFPIQNEFLLGFTNITGDDYGLMTTQMDGNEVAFKDIKTYKYNTTSFALDETNLFKSDETDAIITGKSIQKIGQNILITAIQDGKQRNKAVIFKLDLELKEEWKKDYYYSETSINRLDIGNAIERVGGGYAVIGTHDLLSSTKMVLLLLDENGDYINN